MGRIIKNVIRAAGVFVIAVPMYLLFNLSGASPIYEPGIMTAVLSLVIGASVAIMVFYFSMISKAIVDLGQLDGADDYRARAIDALKKSSRETKEDAGLILAGAIMIVLFMILKGMALSKQPLGKSVLAEDIICMIILGFLCHIVAAFLDIMATFLKSFNMILLLKSN